MGVWPQEAVVVTMASSSMGRACAARDNYRVLTTLRQEQDAATLQRVAFERLMPEMMDHTAEGPSLPRRPRWRRRRSRAG